MIKPALITGPCEKLSLLKKKHFSDHLFRSLKGLKSIANHLATKIATKIM